VSLRYTKINQNLIRVCLCVCVCVFVRMCGSFTHVCATQFTARTSCSEGSTSQLVKKFSHDLINPIFISIFTTLCPYRYKTHPGHNLEAYFFKIHFNIIPPPTPRFSKRSLILTFRCLMSTIVDVPHP